LLESFPLLGVICSQRSAIRSRTRSRISPLHSPARIAMPTTTKTKASEEDAAERQQSDGLPEGDEPQSE